MSFFDQHHEYIRRRYVDENASAVIIAEELKTYPKKIYRVLRKLGVEIKNFSEAQKAALKEGRASIPKVEWTEEQRKKVGEAVYERWQNLSPAERKKISKRVKKQVKSTPKRQQREKLDKAHEGCRRAAKEGSALEKHLQGGLTAAGYVVKWQVRGFAGHPTLRVDLYVPQLNTAIEVDGPSHFFPIWGEDTLKRTQAADSKKTSLLISKGVTLIRIQQKCKELSQKRKDLVLEQLLKELEKIKSNLSTDGQLVEMEVK